MCVSFLPHSTDATTRVRSLKKEIHGLNERENVVKQAFSLFLTCHWSSDCVFKISTLREVKW